MDRPNLGEGAVRIFARLGELLLHWNRLEFEARAVASEAAGGTPVTVAFVSGLTASALAQWLHLLANASEGTEEYKEHIRHCANVLDRLRAYRNHYVHGFHIILDKPTARAVIHSTTLRGSKLKTETDFFEEKDLVPVCNAVIEAYDYVRWVVLAHDSVGQPRKGSEEIAPVAKPTLLPERQVQGAHDWFPRQKT
jgi:hypothetical protein